MKRQFLAQLSARGQKSRKTSLRWGVLTFGMVFLLMSGSLFAGSLSEGFPTRNDYPNGTVVSIYNKSPDTIELSNVNNSDYLAGVVEPEGSGLLTIRDSNSKVYVATSGETEVFVSDINGEINKGDFVGASWISGVGMRAEKDSQQKLLGIALQSFSEVSSSAVEAKNIKTPNGEKDALIGKIAVRLFDREVGPNMFEDNTPVEKFANKLAGKEVAFARILASIGMFTLSVTISGIFLANAIKGSFISLGRNPLASGSIFTSLMQVSGVSISLVLVGALVSYLLLIL